eukprot:3004386-Prymnesium_polylepis.1
MADGRTHGPTRSWPSCGERSRGCRSESIGRAACRPSYSFPPYSHPDHARCAPSVLSQRRHPSCDCAFWRPAAALWQCDAVHVCMDVGRGDVKEHACAWVWKKGLARPREGERNEDKDERLSFGAVRVC